MKRRVSIALAFRDMWQSSCCNFPSVARLKELACAVVDMGCFDRVETNGGAFEQLYLMKGCNPNEAVRELTSVFKGTGIGAQMLERGLSALRMNPVPLDVRELMFKVKAAQGVDVVRSFCGLNDHRNLRYSVLYAKISGMISQVALPIANSPVHTIGHYMRTVDYAVGCGCDEICIKDMSGQGDPSFMAELVRSIKLSYPHVPVWYHGHCGVRNPKEALLEVVRAGADGVDVAIGPLSGGAAHPDVVEVVQWLKEDGFAVKDVDVEAYSSMVALLQKTLSDSLASISSLNCLQGDSDARNALSTAGLPGGMIASLMGSLPDYHAACNANSDTFPKLTFGQFLSCFADEVASVWPALGYPPMVTPYSQYVANAALSNLLAASKGKARWSELSSDVWNMILGRMGKLPGELDRELISLAGERGFEFYDGDPQELYPDSLDRYRIQMLAEGWPFGSDEEDLLEFSMHQMQYREYMAGRLSSCLGIQDSKSVVVDDAVYAAIAMALHEYW